MNIITNAGIGFIIFTGSYRAVIRGIYVQDIFKRYLMVIAQL
jgi:hypothetical protein